MNGPTLKILNGLKEIGEVVYWNRQWTATHDRSLKPKCGVSTMVTTDFAAEMEQVLGLRRRIFWRLKVLSRTLDYGDWSETEHVGEVPR